MFYVTMLSCLKIQKFKLVVHTKICTTEITRYTVCHLIHHLNVLFPILGVH